MISIYRTLSIMLIDLTSHVEMVTKPQCVVFSLSLNVVLHLFSNHYTKPRFIYRIDDVTEVSFVNLIWNLEGGKIDRYPY